MSEYQEALSRYPKSIGSGGPERTHHSQQSLMLTPCLQAKAYQTLGGAETDPGERGAAGKQTSERPYGHQSGSQMLARESPGVPAPGLILVSWVFMGPTGLTGCLAEVPMGRADYNWALNRPPLSTVQPLWVALSASFSMLASI